MNVMARLVVALALFITAMASIAGGTLGMDELVPLMSQEPAVYAALPISGSRLSTQTAAGESTAAFNSNLDKSEVVLSAAIWQAQAQEEKTPYPAMASLDQYLVENKDSEIALARSAAPKSVSDGAEVMALGRLGRTTAVEGTKCFLCLVERSWGAATDFPEFWNPKVRPPFALTRLPQGPSRQSI